MSEECGRTNRNSIKLLLGITLSEVGGSQKVVYDILSNLPEDRYEITLVTSPGGELLEWISKINSRRRLKVKVITLESLKRDISPLNDLKAFFGLYRVLRKGRYDIAHFHTSKIGLLGRIAAGLARVPKIFYTVHGWGLNSCRSAGIKRILGFAEWLGGLICTRVVCVCRHDIDSGVRSGWFCRNKACLIYNGIDRPPSVQKGMLRKELGIAQDTLVIGTIMRLSEPKDPIFTIEVMNEVKKRGYKVKLVILGDGRLRGKCEQLISRLGMKQDAFLLGKRDNVRELLPDIDVVLLFSKREGMPLSILEAMSAGKPVVASNVGGIPELIRHGQNGYLLDNFDIYQGAECIGRLLDNESLRETMGEASRKKVNDSFSLDKMIEKYEILYSGGNPD